MSRGAHRAEPSWAAVVGATAGAVVLLLICGGVPVLLLWRWVL